MHQIPARRVSKFEFLDDVVVVQWGSGFETTWGSVLIGVASCILLVFIALADTVGLEHVELTGLYFIVPLYVALRYRSRMFYPVAAFSAVAYLASQIAVVVWHSGSKETVIAMAINSVVQLSVAFALMALIQTLRIVQRSAITDYLTGTYNRRGLSEYAPRLMAAASVRRWTIAAIAVDLDDFKRVNDRFGHDAGDEILQAVGEILTQNRRKHSLSVRTGGDEFLVLAAVRDAREGQAYARHLRLRINQRLSKASVPATASVGIAMMRHVPHTLDELLSLADAQMYREKSVAKAAVTIPEPIANSA